MKKVRLPEFLNNPNPQIYRTSKNYVTADVETTNVEYGSALVDSNRLVLAVWAQCSSEDRGSLRYRYKFGNEFQLQGLRHAVENADFAVAHNAKFELQWLRRCGLDLTNVLVYDTLLAEKVILGNRPGALDLDSVARRYGIAGKHTLGASLVHGGVSSDEVAEDVLLEYCKTDVEITHEIFKKQLEVLDDKLLAVVFTRCLLTPVLADIEFNGLQLDKERVNNEYERLAQAHPECSSRLSDITGGINLNSGKQVGEFLYDVLGFQEVTKYGRPSRTATGKRRTDTDVYALLRARTAKQRDFLRLKLEYNKLEAALSKYIRKFKVEVDGNNSGLIRATFNQSRTQTHRLSSSGFGDCRVQFQNLDRDYKKLFRARNKDWLIAEADGAQLEFRVAAFLGQDAVAHADIRNEADIHKYTAKILTEAGQETDRQGAKTHTFKPLYGGTSGTHAERTYYDAFRGKYRGIYQTQRGWVDSVLRSTTRSVSRTDSGVLNTPWGLRFYWPDTRVERSGYTTNTSSIFNYPVQSLATAEIIPIAVVYFWHLIKANEARMLLVNTVHDSIICEIPPEERELFKELVVYSLCDSVYKYLDNVYNLQFNVPLGAGIKIGTYWGEGVEDKINAVEPPFKFGE